ncbi:hypothetical protein PGTUg99_008353 [Puccinia graminis f. sp. tritici]|uniref:Uncharacterized protein n=1 Tax=Puccinia graminis f. sp. tritici TaxID=56615 RepID=A0A5B0NXB9_PUCGR|nr:hypothetical protein PGTUg99_008353 [Puccinia graminis f. sp. tritici]
MSLDQTLSPKGTAKYALAAYRHSLRKFSHCHAKSSSKQPLSVCMIIWQDLRPRNIILVLIKIPMIQHKQLFTGRFFETKLPSLTVSGFELSVHLPVISCNAGIELGDWTNSKAGYEDERDSRLT